MNEKSNNLIKVFNNLCRGSDSYNSQMDKGSVRHSLVDLFLKPQKDRIGFVSDYLSINLLQLKNDFKNLQIMKGDSKIWHKVVNCQNKSFTENMMYLASAYVSTNKSQILQMQKFSDDVNEALFLEKHNKLIDILDDAPETTKQSIFYLRTYMAAWHDKPNKLKLELGRMSNSHFISKMIDATLIYANVYTGSDQSVEQVISMINADYGKNDIRSHIVNFILGKTEGDIEKIQTQLFMCMRAHPFDMRNLLVSYFESKLVRNINFTNGDTECFMLVHETLSCERSNMIYATINGLPIPLQKNVVAIEMFERLSIPAEITNMWCGIINPKPFDPNKYSGDGFNGAMVSLRSELYPTQQHYNTVLATMFRYKHTNYGRFTKAVVSGFYLLERTHAHIEIRDVLRLAYYIGAVSLFNLTSPQGVTAAKIVFKEREKKFLDVYISDVNAQKIIDSMESLNDRYSLKRSLWELKRPQRNMNIDEWFSILRQKFVYKNPYYLGVPWSFLKAVENKYRIEAYAGKPDAYYALLLFIIETKAPSANKLRQSLKRGKHLYSNYTEFVHWLCKEYGSLAHLFLMEYCSAEILMKMKFADTQVEALTMRMDGLFLACRIQDYSTYITEAILKKEENEFVASVLLSSIGRHRFSVSWKMFKIDFITENAASCKNILYFINSNERSEQDKEIETTRVFAQFDNGHSMNYTHETQDELRKDMILIELFNNFISHPSQGIEAILSVRVRHNHFRKEFVSMFSEVKNPKKGNLNMYEITTIIPAFEECVFPSIQLWLNERMATFREDKPNSCFNIFPNNDEWQIFREQVDFSTIENATDGFIKWIQNRLESNLEFAKQSLQNDLLADLGSRIANKELQMLKTSASKSSKDSIKKVASVLISALEKKCGQLMSWFEIPEEDVFSNLTSRDLRQLLYQNNYTDFIDNKLKIVLREFGIDSLDWADDKLRIAYYLFLEVVENAGKYSKVGHTTIFAIPYETKQYKGIIVSNKCLEEPNCTDKVIRGHPSKTSDSMYQEGATGLPKIATLSASLVGCEIDIVRTTKNKKFRLQIPLQKVSK